jgi:hypothetical protein
MCRRGCCYKRRHAIWRCCSEKLWEQARHEHLTTWWHIYFSYFCSLSRYQRDPRDFALVVGLLSRWICIAVDVVDGKLHARNHRFRHGLLTEVSVWLSAADRGRSIV